MKVWVCMVLALFEVVEVVVVVFMAMAGRKQSWLFPADFGLFWTI